MFENQQEFDEALLKHVNKLLDTAKNRQPKELLNKIERYYKGSFDAIKDKTTNQRNVIKGIIEAKTTLVIDSQIKTTVIPRTKNLSNPQSLQNICEVAKVMDECLKDVFKNNHYDSWRQMLVRDLVKKMAINETYWDAEDNEIRLRRIPFYRFYPDPAAGCDIQSANYIFIEEMFSPITLKSKYPQFADKLDGLVASGDDQTKKDKSNPAGVITGTIGDGTNQAFSYGDPSSVTKNAKDIKCWKLYLKDDTTFNAEETEKNANTEELQTIKMKYPNGRMILFVDGSKDIVLEDKPIDYEFGFPIDICFNIEGETIWEGQGDVEPLFENQDRINNAYVKSKEMIGKAGAWILNDPANSLKKSDFVNKTVLEIENMGNAGNVPQILSNNTLDKFNLMIEYMEMLKKDSLDIARLNEQIVSGTQEEQTTSGEQVKALNESPLSGIRSLQRNYKEFLVSITNKILCLIQQYYTAPRIIRLSKNNQFMVIPTRGQTDQTTGQPMPIQTFENQEGQLSLIKEIHGNLDIGRYEIEVTAGSERPRSKAENANLMLQLYQGGMLGQGTEAISDILEELDVPGRDTIIARLQKQEEMQEPPSVFNNPDIAKCFDSLLKISGFTKAKSFALEKFGLPSSPDSLVDANVQDVTKQSEVRDVVQMAPVLISQNPQDQAIAQQKISEQNQIDKDHEIAMQENKQNAGLFKKF